MLKKDLEKVKERVIDSFEQDKENVEMLPQLISDEVSEFLNENDSLCVYVDEILKENKHFQFFVDSNDFVSVKEVIEGTCFTYFLDKLAYLSDPIIKNIIIEKDKRFVDIEYGTFLYKKIEVLSHSVDKQNEEYIYTYTFHFGSCYYTQSFKVDPSKKNNPNLK